MMKDNKVGVYYISGSQYPNKEDCFRPEIIYPEFTHCSFQNASGKRNDAFMMVREALRMMGYDQEHWNTEKWNPLGSFINPGNTVVIKPNMVMHYNRERNEGTDCLYTHPSLVAAVIDYVLLAMGISDYGVSEGKIIIGDAPMQECDFEKLIQESGYRDLVGYYLKLGIDIQLKDFRNVKTREANGLLVKAQKEENCGVVVCLDSDSYFNGLSKKKIKNLRITNYNPQILKQHHNNSRHEYKIVKDILDADVVINMPKPKTHRKAGVTIALKNLVGINANKEYLPHHTLGSIKNGGDAYKNPNIFLRASDAFLDWKNYHMQKEHYIRAKILRLFAGALSRAGRRLGELYREGSWYGNDTIWRTILDLNRIFFYADKDGKMHKTKQRKMLIVADMIVSGEKDGPIAPTAKPCGAIAIGENPVCFDELICNLMGFTTDMIPTIAHCREQKTYPLADGLQGILYSNNTCWNRRRVNELDFEDSLKFVRNPGWE